MTGTEQPPGGARSAERARLRPLTPDAMDPRQRSLHRAIADGPRSRDPEFPLVATDGSLLGPFNAFLLSPGVGMALQEVGTALRDTIAITPREREIAILTVAAHRASTFERTTHERIALGLGLSSAELSAIRDHTIPELDSPREQACAELAVALVGEDGWITDAAWRTWVALLGPEGIFELSTVVGYYLTLAMQLRIFEID